MEYGPPDRKAINFYENGGDTPRKKARKKAARQAFPILIELATDSAYPTITYGKLADKIGMQYIPNGLINLKGRRAQWMRLPLGCIWQTLFEYQQESNIEIPYLTTIVVNKDSNMPTVFKEYLGWSDERIISEQTKVYRFEYWTDVLEEIMLMPCAN